MPSEPSDGIFNRPPFTGAGRAWKYPNRHSRQHRNLETRHSRAGGNLDLSVQELIGQNGFLRF
ncbi:hypothetical protein LUZ86_07455 [Neisseria gonorrhoeae]|uniref:hypothetical protein n=1 Tax=Neisseria gonorrhoeae TaxID=485 RepID=UPI0009E5D28D|nr:hypothetical protein [Neisseria gonorrhoeae]MCF2982297.1 hypothetical protein [Neisseria gonorrhoeae]MCF3007469.1 hypothetical protein [Neisseria gonorrhoeae]